MSIFWHLVKPRMARLMVLPIFDGVAAACRIFPAKKLKGIINQRLNSSTSFAVLIFFFPFADCCVIFNSSFVILEREGGG